MEDDPSTGPYFVGRGCYPNKRGVVQLDAAIMTGNNCAFGAVAGLERLANHAFSRAQSSTPRNSCTL